MIFEKLRTLLKTINITDIKQICGVNDQGKITSIEFRNKMRRIGLNPKEIDRIMEVLVVNKKGIVDLNKLNQKIQEIEYITIA